VAKSGVEEVVGEEERERARKEVREAREEAGSKAPIQEKVPTMRV